MTPEGTITIPELQMLRDGTDRRAFHKHLADYFYELPPSTRRNDELPWQLERAGEMEKLGEVLTDAK